MPETVQTPLKPRKTPAKGKVSVAAEKRAKSPKNTFLGRPTDYTDDLVNEICWRISQGESLVQICNDDHIPHCATVYRWLIRHEEFREMYARAREEQADTNADEILAIADEMPPVSVDDRGRKFMDHAFIQWQKQRIDARKWTAAKLKPRKYGERMAVEGVEGGAAIQTADATADKFFEMIRNMEMNKRAG